MEEWNHLVLFTEESYQCHLDTGLSTFECHTVYNKLNHNRHILSMPKEIIFCFSIVTSWSLESDLFRFCNTLYIVPGQNNFIYKRSIADVPVSILPFPLNEQVLIFRKKTSTSMQYRSLGILVNIEHKLSLSKQLSLNHCK